MPAPTRAMARARGRAGLPARHVRATLFALLPCPRQQFDRVMACVEGLDRGEEPGFEALCDSQFKLKVGRRGGRRRRRRREGLSQRMAGGAGLPATPQLRGWPAAHRPANPPTRPLSFPLCSSGPASAARCTTCLQRSGRRAAPGGACGSSTACPSTRVSTPPFCASAHQGCAEGRGFAVFRRHLWARYGTRVRGCRGRSSAAACVNEVRMRSPLLLAWCLPAPRRNLPLPPQSCTAT